VKTPRLGVLFKDGFTVIPPRFPQMSPLEAHRVLCF